jgi:hypothetical protein
MRSIAVEGPASRALGLRRKFFGGQVGRQRRARRVSENKPRPGERFDPVLLQGDDAIASYKGTLSAALRGDGEVRASDQLPASDT